jgi:hypothetical protein
VALVGPELRVLLTRSVAPMREAASFLRAVAGEPPSRALRVGLGLGGEMPALYDPWLAEAQTGEAFFGFIERAERTGRPLYVTYAYAGQNRPRFPEVFAWLDDPSRFEPLAEFRGIEAQYHYRVLRYRDGEAR